jgi:hypothetical protein
MKRKASLLLFLGTISIANAQTPRLTIEAGTDDAPILRSANNHNWRVGPNSGPGTGLGIWDETVGTTRLKIDNSGNVGIAATQIVFRACEKSPDRSRLRMYEESICHP